MREFKSEPFPDPSFRGGAGVQYVAYELLRRGIAPAFPIVDFGYDLLSDHQGCITRLQIKSQFTVEPDRRQSDITRFQLRRSVPPFSALRKGPAQRKPYRAGQFDAMVFVSFARNFIFLVPVKEINLRAHWISFSSDSCWRDAWHILKRRKT